MQFHRNEQLETQLLDEMMAEISDDSRKLNQPSITSLIYCLTKGYYDEVYGQTPDRKTKLYFTIGLGLERNLLVARKHTATEGCYEGIYYHTDAINESSLMEMKSTRMKPGDAPSMSDNWKQQILGYLKCIGATEADFVTLHLIQPDIRAWHLEFTQEEISINWSYLMYRKSIWEYARRKEEPPAAFTYNQDYECKNCNWKLLCDARSNQ